MGNWETGARKPKLNALMRIAKALEVDIDIFIK